MDEYNLSVLVIKEGDWWVAQCLQADLATQTKDFQDINYQIERMIIGHIALCEKVGLAAFESLPPAPQKYWDLFKQCQQRLASIAQPKFSGPTRSKRPTAEVRIAA